MNLHSLRTSSRAGSTLMMTLTVTGVMGLVLVSYLFMISTSNTMTARSQVWNYALAIAEAGAEEALAHLNRNGVNKTGNMFATYDLASEGWTVTSDGYFLQRQLGDAYFQVYIRMGVKPVITATGYAQAPVGLAARSGRLMAAAAPWESGNQFITRTVRVVCKTQGRFTKALLAKSKVDLNGKNVFVDSYHSYDPAGSTIHDTNFIWGIYDETKRRDAGDIAVISGLKDELKVSKSTVRGRLSTGPQGKMKVDDNALVGSLEWCDTHESGIQPGWSADDANFDMPDVELPFASGFPPGGGFVGTNYYDYILSTGDWEIDSLKGSVLITGNARIIVNKKIEFSEDPKDNHGIEFDPGSRLEIYMKGKSAKIVGKKDKRIKLKSKGGTITNTVRMYVNGLGNPTNFFYFGLDKNTKLEVKNVDDLSGIIYAPNAHITFKAGSTKYYHCNINGAAMGREIKLEKNVSFHYDENIANLAPDSYAVESWSEI